MLLQSVSLQGSRGLFESLSSLMPNICTLFPSPSLYPPQHVPAALQSPVALPVPHIPRAPIYPPRTSANPTCPTPRPGSPSSTSPQSRYRVPSPSLSLSSHTRSPQLPHRDPASPGPRCPDIPCPCPVSVSRTPQAAPLPQARPRRGGAARSAPPLRW